MNVKILMLILIAAFTGAVFVNSYAIQPGEVNKDSNLSSHDVLKKFNSPAEIKSFLKKNAGRGSYGREIILGSAQKISNFMADAEGDSSLPSSAPSPSLSAVDFSTTNIQVRGVDEADIVKNDGRYIYVLSKGTVKIVDAYPPDDAEILSTIKIKGIPLELYVIGDRLVVLGNDYASDYSHLEEKRAEPQVGVAESIAPYPRTDVNERAAMYVYDISNRNAPRLSREIFSDGNYLDSRMIGDYVYVVATKKAYQNEVAIPQIYDSERGRKTPDVYYFDAQDSSYSFTSIIAVDVHDENEEASGKIYLLGSAQSIFVSKEGIYITYHRWAKEPYILEKTFLKAIEPLIPPQVTGKIKTAQDSEKSTPEKEKNIKKALNDYLNTLSESGRGNLEKEIQIRTENLEHELVKSYEKTIIHRISIMDGEIEHTASGEVPGRVLNQFSMDEYDGYFRIATTRRGAQGSSNNVYVLGRELDLVGKLEDLAPGESIYSARFIGKRAYLVTFQKVDPLFAIDLSDPRNPKVLGKLKIPGYSDYLHPYDENHIIGLGKDTIEAETGNFAWYQGIKLALFDVSDVERPKEISKFVIGDRGTDSYALRDHKAFLFSKEKNLLVIPVLLAEINRGKYYGSIPATAYGDYVWQGAYVFNVGTAGGFELRGRISHNEDSESFAKSGRFYHSQGYRIKRSLYMDDALYTISDEMIKINGLYGLHEINSLYLEK